MQAQLVPSRTKRKDHAAQGLSKVQESRVEQAAQVERWRPVVGYEGRYEVSDLGRVKSLLNPRRGAKILKYGWACGYPAVSLLDRLHRSKKLHVHALVLTAFVGKRPNPSMECSHKNGIRADPNLKNLEWVTGKQNEAMKHAHGTVQNGCKNGNSKLTERDIPEIRSLLRAGKRLCHIGREYGVHYKAIARIRNGRTWTHVK